MIRVNLLLLMGLSGLVSGVLRPGLCGEHESVPALQLKRLAVLGDARMRHANQVTALVPLSDGRRLLSSAQDRTVRLWNLETGEEIHRFIHPESAWCVVSLPGEKTCISTSGKKALMEWDLTTGQKVRELEGHEHTVFRCAVSPDGARLLAGDGGPEVLEWSLTGEPAIVRRYKIGSKDDSVYGTAWSPDGSCFALGGQQKQIWFFSADTGECLRKTERVSKDLYTLQFSPDGTRLLSTSADKTVRLWSVDEGKVIWKAELASDVKVAAFSPDGKRVAAGLKGAVCVMDAADGKEQLRLDTADDEIWPVAFSRDGRQLLAGGSCLVRRFDLDTGKRLFPPADFTGPCSPLKSVVLDPQSGHLLCAGETDKAVFVVDPKTGAVLQAWPNEQGLSHLTLSGDGSRVFGLDGQKLSAWEMASGKLLWSKELEGYPEGIAASHDGSRLILIDSNEHRILDGVDGNQIRTIQEKEGRYVQHVAVSPSGQMVVACYGDGLGAFYRMPDLTLAGTFSLPVKAKKAGEKEELDPDGSGPRIQYINVRAATVLPASGVLLMADDDHTLRQWRPRVEECHALNEAGMQKALADLDDESFTVRQDAIQRLIGCGDDARPILDTIPTEENQELRKTLEYVRGALSTRQLPNRMTPHCLTFKESIGCLQGHPDGVHWAFVEGYGRKSIVLGRATANDLTEVARLEDPNLPNALAFSADGRYLYTVNGNCTVSVYALTEGEGGP